MCVPTRKFQEVVISKDDSFTLGGAEKYVVTNCSINTTVQVVGMANSILLFELLPYSTVRLDTAATILSPYGDARIGYIGYRDSSVPPIPTPEPEPQPLPSLEGKYFYLDPGHGGSDPGAVNSKLGYQEKVAALAIAQELQNLLLSAGARVFLSRADNDTRPSLAKRAEQANFLSATAFISIHLNSAENKDASGAEVLVYKHNTQAHELAEAILTNLIAKTGFKNRGIKERPELTVLKKTKMPAVLVEVGFISNEKEARKLFDKEVQFSIASAIAAGIVEEYA